MVTLTLNAGTLDITSLIQLLYDYFPFANVALNPEVHVQEAAFSIPVELEGSSPPPEKPHIYFSCVGSFEISSGALYHCVTT